MTATAFALDPALDLFDDADLPTNLRPDLRLIQGQGSGIGGGKGGGRAAVPSATTLASVELYRRRRFLALVAATAMVLAIAWAAGISVTSFAGAAADVTADAVPAVHVVMPGDSYAAIATDLGAANPVEAGALLRAANGNSELIVGQRLVVDIDLLAAAG